MRRIGIKSPSIRCDDEYECPIRSPWADLAIAAGAALAAEAAKVIGAKLFPELYGVPQEPEEKPKTRTRRR